MFLVIFTSGLSAQSLPWSKVELTPVYSTAKAQMEPCAKGELVILTSGSLYHVLYDSSYQMIVSGIENQVTSVDHFVLCDIDWDGDLDILAVVPDAPIQVYEKINDEFIFNAKLIILNGIKMKTLSIHDYNDDGRGDLLVNLDLYVAEGPNQFTRVHTSLPSNYIPKVAQFFDYDKDGDKDLMMQLVTNLFMYRNNGNSGLSQISIPQFNHNTSWAKKIRVGHRDEVIIYSGSPKLFYRLIYENGTFDQKEIGTLTLQTQDFNILAIDMDEDGVEELISNQQFAKLTYIRYDTILDTLTFHTYDASNQLGFCADSQVKNLLHIRFADRIESVQWDAQQQKLVKLFSSSTVFIPSQFLDIDGDGLVDLLNGKNIRKYLGGSTFENPVTVNIDSTGGEWRDFDGDHDLDYVLKHGWYQNIGGLLFNPYTLRTPDPVFTDPVIFFTNIIFREDIDGDGDIDVITYNRFGEPLELYENDNDVFTLRQVLATNAHISGYLRGFHFIDLDGDGLRDILFAAASGMIWIKNEGGLSFAEPKILYDDNESPLLVDISDINLDGISDVLLSTGEIITGAAKGSVHLFLGAFEGQPKHHQLASGNGYHRAKFARLDQSGWNDIVYSNDSGITTLRFENIGQYVSDKISFDQKIDHLFSVIDLDGDGDDDIITANTSSKLFYLINGTFSGNSCPERGVYLRNQLQVDEFSEKYGHCPVIKGDLFIGNVTNTVSTITDISGLENIKKIEGDLVFRNNTQVKDFLNFSTLDTVLGSFILDQFLTTDLKGFEILKYIGKDLYLKHQANGSNNWLLDTKELGNVQHVGGKINVLSDAFSNLGIQSQEVFNGDITFFNVERLSNIDFLKNTKEIKGKLDLGYCAVTTLEPAKNIEKVKEFIVRSEALTTISMNSKIDSLSGSLIITGQNIDRDILGENDFARLKYIGGNLNLGSKTLTGFQSLRTLQGNLSLGGREIASTFLPDFQFLGGGLYLGAFEKIESGFLKYIDSIPGAINFLDNTFPDLTFMSNIKQTHQFDLNLNPNIRDLNGLHPDLNISNRLLLFRCAKLNLCDVPFVCKHIEAGKPIMLSKNGAFCSDVADLTCLNNSFTGQIFYDFNQNGIRDQDEYSIPDQKVKALGKPHSVFTSNDGMYRIYFQEGDSIDIGLQDVSKFTTTSQPERFMGRFIPDLPSNAGNDFGVVYTHTVHQSTVRGQMGIFICNRPFTWDVQITNEGSFVELNKMKIQLPASIQLDSIVGSAYTYDASTGEIWIEIDTLYPFEIFRPKLWMTAPAWVPQGNNTYVFNTTLFAYNTWGELVLIDQYTETPNLLCSYDPNDKLVTGPYQESNLLFGKPDYLEYVIRFQNTGNYYAENILLVDTLSNFLDVDSIEILMSSHEPVEISLKENVLKFYFPDIMLPDSTLDFVGSQGFVRFRIKTKSELPANEEINNTAFIYFDYNDPIVTNTVKSVVLLPDGIKHQDRFDVSLFPQPAFDKLNIKYSGNLDMGEWTLGIHRATGEQVIKVEGNVNLPLDIGSLTPGYYVVQFYKLTTGDRFFRGFIKL
ncbi:MAG: VCBS repeat-containing protein [Saprospiraceae bacterium]